MSRMQNLERSADEQRASSAERIKSIAQRQVEATQEAEQSLARMRESAVQALDEMQGSTSKTITEVNQTIDDLRASATAITDEIRAATERASAAANEISEAARSQQEQMTTAMTDSAQRQAAQIDRQAEQIEPVVQSLVKLAKEVRGTLKKAQDAQERQLKSWQESQSDAAAAMLDQKAMIDQATADLKKVRAQTQKAARAKTWQTWAMVAMTALIAGSAPLIGFWLLVDGAVTVQEGQVWLRLR